MPYALIFTEQYNRKAAKFIKKHPDLRQQYLKTLQLLQANPFLIRPCAYMRFKENIKVCIRCPLTYLIASRWSY